MRTHGMMAGKGGEGGDGAGRRAEWGDLQHVAVRETRMLHDGTARGAALSGEGWLHALHACSRRTTHVGGPGLETLRQIKRPLRWIHVCIVESLPHTCWSATICTGLSFLPCCCLVPVAAVFLG